MPRINLSSQVLNNHIASAQFVRRNKPRWLRMALPASERYHATRQLIRTHGLHTVCQEAACPNMGECWSAGVATVMILGDTCTRSCGFCNIKTGRPPTLDTDEPRRVAEAIALMKLRHVVITSVNRDELDDGGAAIWAETINRTRCAAPETKIEVLIPDFCGDKAAIQTVLDARPDVLNHNLECVPRLYPAVRPQAKYTQSLDVLRYAKRRGFITKTGIMVGIGERDEEVNGLMGDLFTATPGEHDAARAEPFCDILTIGQYLQPSPRHLPVARFVTPEQFEDYRRVGEAMGLACVESGPMVRSSYHADQAAAAVQS